MTYQQDVPMSHDCDMKEIQWEPIGRKKGAQPSEGTLNDQCYDDELETIAHPGHDTAAHVRNV
jgi:hypothetical protein